MTPVTVAPSPEAPGRRTAVVALGGNALAPGGEHATIYDQFRHARESLAPVVELALADWNVCVVHGNGPQVGDELARNEAARAQTSPLPLGVLVAETAGWIGYMIQQSVDNALRRAGSTRGAVTVITQVRVDPTDAALQHPSKFIGQSLELARASELRGEGHTVGTDGNGRLRRMVGSPAPLAIHEISIIRDLVSRGTIVIACGGGGAPVYRTPARPTLGWEGIDAVIDKDLVAAVLARELGAALLLILTDVDAVYADWGTPSKRPVPRLTVDEADAMDRAGAFGEGSMAPKIRGAVDFVRRTGGRAIITSLSRGQEAVRAEAGTVGTTITATVETQ